MTVKYSVVIPVYNSANIVRNTVGRVREFFAQNALPYEIILVNDGSKDASWSVIAELAKSFPEVVAINLLKNYGQHNANLCGFRASSGDYVITMDDDLQNPPEEISKLIAKISEGYDLVIGQFEIKQHSLIRRWGSRFVSQINRKVFDVQDGLVLSNFRIIRRDVIDRVCQDSSYAPYIPGLVLKFSSERCNVLVQHAPRQEGKSNYTAYKIARLVGTILFNHSPLPLRYGALFGFLVAGGSFLLAVFFLLQALFRGTSAPGWASLVVLLAFFNGVMIMIISIIGEYILRILREIGTKQSYEIKEVIRS
jgi:glycosyltransferase involved in cell wall biosynthesis